MSTVPTCPSTIVYSVAELNQMVGMTLSEGFPALQVSGEVSNFSCPRSGHWYFSLKDDKAQVRCVFFKGQQRQTMPHLTEGLQIIVKARLRLYEVRGDFQLTVESIDKLGDGILQQRFEQLKNRLAAEGLFDQSIKKTLPSFVQTLGVITSPTGAAIHDVLTVLKRRFPLIQVIIYPTLVQGQEASKHIVKQIQIANQRQECDVLLLTRGGGSLEDLWCFNEEPVARAIFGSTLPIVSAVGHEIDTTIVDFVSDVRAPTPSAGAELLSPDQTIWHHHIQQLEQRLLGHITQQLSYLQEKLNHLKQRLRHPAQQLQNRWQQLDDYERRLQHSIQSKWEQKNQKLIELTRNLNILNPLATLHRGYSLTRRLNNRHVLKDATCVKTGDLIRVTLSKGEIICKVSERIINA